MKNHKERAEKLISWKDFHEFVGKCFCDYQKEQNKKKVKNES